LKGSDIAAKYPAETREIKSLNFVKQPQSYQLEILVSAMSGEKSKVIEEKEKATESAIIMGRIDSFLGDLHKINQFDLWLKESKVEPIKVFDFSNEEKVKYHDALIRFYQKVSGETVNGKSADLQKSVSVEPDTPLDLNDGTWNEL